MKIDIEKNAKEIATKDSRGPVNYVTEYLRFPSMWKIDERYDWLNEYDKRELAKYEFDYGDILNAAKNFNDRQETADLLMTDQKTLDSYCLTLWRKPWIVIHKALINAARNELKSEVFDPWARKGNGVAMKVMDSVGKLSEGGEGEEKRIAIRLVNDVEEGE